MVHELGPSEIGGETDVLGLKFEGRLIGVLVGLSVPFTDGQLALAGSRLCFSD